MDMPEAKVRKLEIVDYPHACPTMFERLFSKLFELIPTLDVCIIPRHQMYTRESHTPNHLKGWDRHVYEQLSGYLNVEVPVVKIESVFEREWCFSILEFEDGEGKFYNDKVDPYGCTIRGSNQLYTDLENWDCMVIAKNTSQ